MSVSLNQTDVFSRQTQGKQGRTGVANFSDSLVEVRQKRPKLQGSACKSRKVVLRLSSTA